MTKVEHIVKMIDDEINRLELNPKEIEQFEILEKLSQEKKMIYTTVSREVFHNFFQVAKNAEMEIGQYVSMLVERESKIQFEGKREYSPYMDYKGLKARNHA